VLALVARQRLQRAAGDRKRQKAERQVDPEDHAPVQMLGEHAAEHRACDRGGRKHRAEIALVAAAFARRDGVADDGLRQRDQSAAADALKGARRDQRRHGRRERAGDRAENEDRDAAEQHRAAAVDVRKLAVERRDGGGGEQVGGDDPGEAFDVRIGAADGGKRSRHDGLVQRREEHRQHQAEQDAADGGMVEALGRLVDGGHDGTPEKRKRRARRHFPFSRWAIRRWGQRAAAQHGHAGGDAWRARSRNRRTNYSSLFG